MTPVLVSLVGCTGAGKTAVAIEVARLLRPRVNVEIVSADSRQVYRGMDVGTAKPTREERAAVPHHMIDVADPRETYTAARYGREARAVIAEIRARGAVPLLVGGSGLYLRAVEEGLFEGPAADAALRARLHEEADAKGEHALHARLAEVDPEAAKRLHPRDRVRVIRALEVWEATGVAMSEHHRRHREAARGGAGLGGWIVEGEGHGGSANGGAVGGATGRPLRVGLEWPVPVLDARIAARAEAMLSGGWVEEVAQLSGAGVPEDAPGMNAVGYPEVARLAQGKITRAEALERIVRATRQFAKRQRTWFRGVADVEWLRVEGESDLLATAGRIADELHTASSET